MIILNILNAFAFTFVNVAWAAVPPEPQPIDGTWVLIEQTCGPASPEQLAAARRLGHMGERWKKIIRFNEGIYQVTVEAGTKCTADSPVWDRKTHPNQYCGLPMSSEGPFVASATSDLAVFKGTIKKRDPDARPFPAEEDAATRNVRMDMLDDVLVMDYFEYGYHCSGPLKLVEYYVPYFGT